jgi:hypothetical protein
LETWIALHSIYNLLATHLGLIGLPLRGALSVGTLRIRDQEPRLVLGESLIYCASLEPTLKALVVAIDDSAVRKIYEIEDKNERAAFHSMLSLMNVPTNAGLKKLFVMNWMIAPVPHALVVMYRDLVGNFRKGDRDALAGLVGFLPKFSNSREMIKTLRFDDEFRKQAEREWEEAFRDSESIWSAVADAAKKGG